MTENKKAAKILITAGPATTRLDTVRKITNHSTGGLGRDLALSALEAGHQVTLLRSRLCTVPPPPPACQRIDFTDIEELQDALYRVAESSFDAVWHAAAVGDFLLYSATTGDGQVLESGSKWPSRIEQLVCTFKPAPKLIRLLPDLFPGATRVGWKYATEGSLTELRLAALEQIRENRTHLCIINGPAYGPGFGVCDAADGYNHVPDAFELAQRLLE